MNIETSFSINTDLVISPRNLIDTYLFGVKIKNDQGQDLPIDAYIFWIKAAQQQIEAYFNLKLIPQVIVETRDYHLDDYRNFGYIRVSYPAVKAYTLKGIFGQIEQIRYQQEWLSTKRSNEVPEMYWRNIYLVPNAGTYYNGVSNAGVTFQGVFGANLLWTSRKRIPNYWELSYLTGFLNGVPSDLLDLIGKIAAINLLHIAGDLILGAGIASYSLGVDGLSQSISSTSSSTSAGYGARILAYNDDIQRTLPILESKYRGVTINSL